MYQGTTPTIPIRFEGVQLTEARVYITLYDEHKKEMHTFASGTDFNISLDGSDSTTDLSLTQEMTLNMGTGICSIQGRWVFPDGVAGATQVAEIQMQKVLLQEVIQYD